jgi:hypothetical protein
MLNGLPVTGMVRSVREPINPAIPCAGPSRWSLSREPQAHHSGAVQASSVLLDTVTSASELTRQLLFSCRAALRDAKGDCCFSNRQWGYLVRRGPESSLACARTSSAADYRL